MRRSPRNLRIACDHAGLTHFGGVYFFHEFLQLLQLRLFLARNLEYPRRNQRYCLSHMILALVYPIVLGLDRLETASFLRSNGTLQYLAGLPSFPDPQTLRRFLLQAPPGFWQQLHRVNNRLLQKLVHLPDHRSRLIFDLDSTVLTLFGHQEGAEIGYNPRYRGKRSYSPLICMEANSSYLWDTQLRKGDVGPWDGSIELLESCCTNVPSDIRELRLRADAGFSTNPVFDSLESHGIEYAIVARMTGSVKRVLPDLRYTPAAGDWEMAEFENRPQGWSRVRRFVVARRLKSAEEKQPTLFAMGRFVYRGWVTNLALTPLGIWHFYDARAAVEPRIGELLQDYALRRIPTRSFAANALFLEIIRLAYNLVTAFQQLCLQESWQRLTLSKLRYKLFLLPGELTRPQNRPILRLRESSMLQNLADDILKRINNLAPVRL